MRNLKFSIFFMLLFNAVSFSQQLYNTGHPIDDILQECLTDAENQSAEGNIHCEYKARVAWEKEIEKYYGMLMKNLDDYEKKLLKDSHKSWVIYRDKEMAFAEDFYKGKRTEAWLVVHAARLTNIMRTRAMELIEYYDATIDTD